MSPIKDVSDIRQMPTAREVPAAEEGPPPEPVEEKTPDDVTEDDVPDMNAVFRICFHFWEMQPIEIYGQLGYRTQVDAFTAMKTPRQAWEAWLTIKNIKQPKKE